MAWINNYDIAFESNFYISPVKNLPVLPCKLSGNYISNIELLIHKFLWKNVF